MEFGQELFSAAFRGDIGARWAVSLEKTRAKGGGLRLRLRLTGAPELAKLPWEFLYADPPRDFVAMSEWTPLVRFLDVQGSGGSLHVDPPLRILVFAALPSDLGHLEAESEMARLRDAVAELRHGERVELDEIASGRFEDLRQALKTKTYHVLHYIGHGGFDLGATEGTLCFVGDDGESDEVGADEFAHLIAELDSPPRLVVLNSCRGAQGDRLNVFASTAGKLLDRGVPAVIAMQYAITDDGAIAFGSHIYSALAEGAPLDAAMSEARFMIRRATRSLEWATPVLYLRAADGVIFDVVEPAATIPGRTTYPHAEAWRLTRIVLNCPLVATETDQAVLVKAVAGKADPTKAFIPWVTDVIQRGLTHELLTALQAQAVSEEQRLAVEEVRQGWSRLDWISEPLEVFSARADFQAVISAYRRAVPPGRALRVDSLAEALDAAAQFGRRGTRECPLYRMVVILEHLSGAQVDEGWFDLEGDQLAGLRADARGWVEDSPGRLVIDLGSGGTPPGLLPWPREVAAYLYRRLPEGPVWERHDRACDPTLEGVQGAVAELLSEAQEVLSSFRVGFILPRLLFSSEPECWPIPMDFAEPSPIGLEHPVVLHSAERLRARKLHPRWVARADKVHERLKHGPADISWVDDTLRDNLPAIRHKLADPLAALVGLGFVAGATPTNLNGDALLTVIGAGVPYLLWVEEDPGDWQDMHHYVDDLLSGGRLDNLAERIHDERVLGGDPLVRGMRVIWDDPMQLPESLRPSAAVRVTLEQEGSVHG
jgi:hypothetical protein